MAIIKKIIPIFIKFILMKIVLQKIFNLSNVYSFVTIFFCYYFVTVIIFFQVLLNSYVNSLLEENNIIENFIQGDLWRNKIELYFKGKIVFPLFIYYDDFEVTMH